MPFEDMTSREWANRDEDEEAFRDSQYEQIQKLKEELNVSDEQMKEFVWKVQMDALRGSDPKHFSEGIIELLEETKSKIKDFGTMMDMQELFARSGADNILQKKDTLTWELLALEKAKEEKK